MALAAKALQIARRLFGFRPNVSIGMISSAGAGLIRQLFEPDSFLFHLMAQFPFQDFEKVTFVW